MIGRNAPRPNVPDAVALQWANGKTVARPAGSAARFVPFVGFHVEVGRDAELDAALGGQGVTQVEIRHQRPGGAEVVAHWSLGPELDLLPVTSGPVASTVAACLANGAAAETALAGIGLRWGEGERSRMAVRGFVRPLWELGYRRLVQLGVRSRMTDHLLAALLDHTRAAVAADQLVDRVRYPDRQVSPAELWLPLGPGEEAEFGRVDQTLVTPLRSYHPEALDVDYLRGLWRPGPLYEAAVQAWPMVQAWAKEFALTGGDEQGAPAEER